MDYNELYKKAQRDLENVRVQKAQVKTKIDELVQSLDLDPDKDIASQVEALKADLESKQAEMTKELKDLESKLKEFE